MPYSGAVLEYIAQYMQYWYMYKDKEDVPDMDVPVDMCLEVLMAADFLRMDRESAACHTTADIPLTNGPFRIMCFGGQWRSGVVVVYMPRLWRFSGTGACFIRHGVK